MIDILMSTYNGANYLPAQIESIIAQTVTEWQLLIRDDGSTDHTIQILKHYASLDNRITICEKEQGNVGVIASFERLLTHYSHSPYIAFSDQDDVWKPQKLQTLLSTIQQAENTYGNQCPLVAHSDLIVTDTQLQPIASSFWVYSHINPYLLNSNKYYLGICNSVTGGAMLFNKAAATLSLPFYKNAYMHDAWIALKTIADGGHVIPVNQPLVLYRQHGNNVLGAVKYKFCLTDWKRKWWLAKRSYTAAHPLVFHNPIHFLYWKTIYFIASHTCNPPKQP
ncbi:MAG: glycosyltransferase family 2 protein [Paludibacter sp.]|nr:glycosyltransferase family 2 protein [Bacteroidales bacterium]MCM1068588.1 glycosyltransferase family 2 protein [Prevotella sp.]MCM1353252.1 glycosyltransferase family 2 protein [Bacteroides sp.]MCM1442340.1 glycosyltransferase family 2 protein [Muribaculum sp.]MCM1481159.1 glycosyltransferase family 2 protein [Paludibacter sp.]